MTDINKEGKGWMSIPLTGALLYAGGEIAAVLNPEGVTCLILRTILYITTPSTGSCNISIGLAAAKTTSATDIINALAIDGSITGKYYNGNVIQYSAKTEVAAPAAWTKALYLTATGSASSVGFVGTLYVEYLRV